jgi:hypothetical protein
MLRTANYTAVCCAQLNSLKPFYVHNNAVPQISETVAVSLEWRVVTADVFGSQTSLTIMFCLNCCTAPLSVRVTVWWIFQTELSERAREMLL